MDYGKDHKPELTGSRLLDTKLPQSKDPTNFLDQKTKPGAIARSVLTIPYKMIA